MSKKAELKRLIEDKVFIRNKDQQVSTHESPDAWIFDFRKLLMNGKASDLITDLFYETFIDRYPFQISALEIAGVPLATSIMNKFYAKGHHDINAFFIRKSRKKTGLMRMIEGEIQDTKKIILVDDIINSGDSFWRQIEVLEALGYSVDTVWSILRFRKPEYYKRFALRNIKVESLFELNDLTDALGNKVRNLDEKPEKPELAMPFSVEWGFKSDNPTLAWVVPKSQPVIDESKLYFGSDNRTFWAINQADGSVAWQYQVGRPSKKKSIFSNPALYHNTVIFGAYDGNVYCLDKETGKPKWIAMEADWVGSSPAVAPELGLVFIGLEYGIWGKYGAIIALNADTGKPVWIDRTHKGLTHCSPRYLPEHQQVVIGSNDGVVRLYDALSGDIAWTFTTFGGASNSGTTINGFGEGDIKESFAFSPEHDFIIFGSMDGFVYILKRSTGHLVKHFKCDFGIYSTPYIYNDKVYFTSTDKLVRCVDLNTLELIFEENMDNTRLFSAPTVIKDKLYVGTNGARLYELDPQTGEKLAYFQTLERITNTVIYNPKTDRYFLPTFANEILALSRNEVAETPKKTAE